MGKFILRHWYDVEKTHILSKSRDHLLGVPFDLGFYFFVTDFFWLG